MNEVMPGLLVGDVESSGIEEVQVRPNVIQVRTAHSVWIMRHEPDGALAQLFYGPAESAPADTEQSASALPPVYPVYGDGYILEPALRATHADGNTSTSLSVVAAEIRDTGDENITETRVQLRDPAYPFFVTLCFRAYRAEDVIEQWTEIRHEEPGAVTLYNFASTALSLPTKDVYLTAFHGDWADEMHPAEQRLTPGIKVVDSKLGTRAAQYAAPSFLLSLGAPAQEESGAVLAGSLEWSGSFQLAFEVSTKGTRVLGGLNPFASQYHLLAGRVFTTPVMLWSYSANGMGSLSRQMHRWARRYALRDGNRPRDVMLNNWEATYFQFDESRLVSLLDATKEVGADLFLLDDGWFGNNHPRDDDGAGLGDWQVNRRKLPRGLSYLADEAQRRGLRFGIWLEPEMVNPRSDLFEAHPDWVIQQPGRQLKLERNQLVLDLTRPEVREFAFHVLDDTLSQNPGISYVKWDCNRFFTQPGSPFLPPAEQSHLFIEYGRALYEIMERVRQKHPAVEMMLCSGGGGRADYGALRHFHEFWPSDNTDPTRRIAIQWNYSYFFPAIALAAHVTRMNERPLKLAIDVATSGRLGLDLDLAENSREETRMLAAAVTLYKNELRDIVQFGDLYRLEAPGEGARVSLNYVSRDAKHAVLFIYQIQPAGEAGQPCVRLRGLVPTRRYLVREVNLPEHTNSSMPEDGKDISGNVLMETGLTNPCHQPMDSAVVSLIAVADDQ